MPTVGDILRQKLGVDPVAEDRPVRELSRQARQQLGLPPVRRNCTVAARDRSERRFTGKLDPSVYKFYVPVPLASGLKGKERMAAEAMITEMIAEMPGPAVKDYLLSCRLADKDGKFDMSARIAREGRSTHQERDSGDHYLKLICDMGLWTQETSGHSGNRASEYRLVPWSPTLHGRAMTALKAFRARRSRSRRRRS